MARASSKMRTIGTGWVKETPSDGFAASLSSLADNMFQLSQLNWRATISSASLWLMVRLFSASDWRMDFAIALTS